MLLFNSRGASPCKFSFNLYVGYSFLIIVFFELLMILNILFSRNVKIDFVSIILTAQLYLYSFGILIFGGGSEAVKYLMAAINSLFIYFVIRNSEYKLLSKKMLYIFEIVSLIMIIQTGYMLLSSVKAKVPLYMVKSYIHIPIGMSNYIAGFLILLFVFIMNVEKRVMIKTLLLICLLLGVIFTRSSSALLLIFLVIIYEINKHILLEKSFQKKILYLCLELILISSVLFFIKEYSYFFSRFVDVVSNLLSGTAQGVELASNSRLSLYRQVIQLIEKRPLLGYGLAYTDQIGTLSHNYFLDQILKGGILNLFITLCLFVSILYKFNKYKHDKYVNSIKYVLIVALINNLYEPLLGTLPYDLFFWIICGLGMLRIRDIKENRITGRE